ncbi:ribosomal biogenesis factor isoform X2 [Hemicordylus capensis]|uniref:ribosomal biogenesis factor isoform X2 n=1 Tax=Hemicordylus capensis TaxID=884348 RepID=UPI002303325D|nr:ribosomal biogenesis factor isoform X2 [Hemicordylus capensis]
MTKERSRRGADRRTWSRAGSSCFERQVAMGKNKAKGQKQKNVFQVANKKIMKIKHKAKPVTTSLKKINIVNAEKVNLVNKVFTEVQKEVQQLSKAPSLDSPKNCPIPKPLEGEPANVDAAANLLSQL